MVRKIIIQNDHVWALANIESSALLEFIYLFIATQCCKCCNSVTGLELHASKAAVYCAQTVLYPVQLWWIPISQNTFITNRTPVFYSTSQYKWKAMEQVGIAPTKPHFFFCQLFLSFYQWIWWMYLELKTFFLHLSFLHQIHSLSVVISIKMENFK